ncbi:glutamate receptor, ionotropic, invertebrate [Schistosoma bovis]|uniref:Glutamate receptor, ionotropic, invertebrate n=1 Tax=Schistosoma bovis TaxID=6184 RepID=A0A430QP84_SCHBO|nr:glutamate receptor, ionotropic, invertebrate [Schistosoma bovis]
MLIAFDNSVTDRQLLNEFHLRFDGLKGALIKKDDVAQEICFKKSIQAANKLLQQHDSTNHRFQLIPIIETIDGDDSFEATRKACQLIERQVIAIYGPSTPYASSAVQALCNQFGIPHLQIDWGYHQTSRGYALNVHPHYLAFGQALYDYVQKAEYWDTVAVIYSREENSENSTNISSQKSQSIPDLYHPQSHANLHSNLSYGLLKFDYLLRTFDQPLMLRKWDVSNDNQKYVIKQFKITQTHFRFIVDIPFWEIQEFLALDVQLVDPKAFESVQGANITTFTILHPMNEDSGYGVAALLDDIRVTALQDKRFTRSSTSRRISPTHSALLYDGLSLLAMGVLSSSRSTNILPPAGLSCSVNRVWNPGLTLINDIKAVHPTSFRGLTGPFQFDGHGWRSNAHLIILELSRNGFQEEKPYMMYKGKTLPGQPKSTDPKDWEGFCISLLNYISEDLQFTYTINLVPDSTYGNMKIVDGVETWDGMVQELRTRRADLAVGSFTITYDRERVIDFTTPFMYLGISIIYKRPEDKESHLFSFLTPLSPPVWGYILAALIMVSLVLFVVARFSPYEWKVKHPCIVDSDVVENNFNVSNSLWFTFGSLMQKGSDILPHATSTRIIAGFWWFFTLIVISSYTANLAAFLTVARMVAPIENAEDLAKQTKIKYGSIQGGSTTAFFEESNFSTYKRMWQFMSSQKGLLMNNTVEAIKRVKREEYAFLLESTMNEYYTQRDCELMQVGGLLDSKGYGIGLPEGSKYRDPISETILKLQKSQVLEQLKFYWWRKHDIEKPCDTSPTKSSDANSLGVEKVGGCFVMLLIGMVVSLLVGLLEFVCNAYRRVATKKHSLHEEIARDFRFSMACSSVRSQAAEDAMRLPPPPSLNCLSSGEGEQKQSFSASLAYAPCLPAPVSVPVMNENHIDKDVLQSLNQSLSSRGMLTESKHTPVVGDSEKKATPSMSYTRTQDYNAQAIEFPKVYSDSRLVEQNTLDDIDTSHDLMVQPQRDRTHIPYFGPDDSEYPQRQHILHSSHLNEQIDSFDREPVTEEWRIGPAPILASASPNVVFRLGHAKIQTGSAEQESRTSDNWSGPGKTHTGSQHDVQLKKVSC